MTDIDKKPPSSYGLSMVEWYSPTQLLKTARDVLVSSLFSHHADRRAFYTEWQNPKLEPYTVYPEKDEVWLDFVADTGDGGNSTYTIAKLMLAETLQVEDKDANLSSNDDYFQTRSRLTDAAANDDKVLFPRADVLVFGGDLVYPVASEENYSTFFYEHFKSAIPQDKQHRFPLSNSDTVNRTVFAFPQNHDWYDSLASFSQIFCHKEKERFLDMYCPQEQSYAALQLPHDWWLFGLDFALNGDIDELQFEYFRKIIVGYDDEGKRVGGLGRSSKVIMVYPEPVWSSSALDESNKSKSFRYQDLEKLIEKQTGRMEGDTLLEGKDISVRLAGDQHYYRRYSTESQRGHLITCGSGGAFLHPTHDLKADTLYHNRKLGAEQFKRRYEYQCADPSENCLRYSTNDYQSYPSRDTSRTLSFDIFKKFIINNNKFGVVTAATYFLVVWLNFSSLIVNFRHSCREGGIQFSDFLGALKLWFWSILLSPDSGLLVIIIIMSLGFFALQSNKHRPISFLVGTCHGLSHFFMIFCIYWALLRHGLFVGGEINPICDNPKVMKIILAGMMIALSGFFIGPLVMGIYLFISLNFLRLHTNEAFSSLRTQDYKGFLKLRITQEKLEAFFIGVNKVPTEWQPNPDPAKPTWSEVGEPIAPILIDYWTVKNKLPE